MDGKEIIRHYPHEHYTSVFNSGSGLSLRIEDSGFDEPFWASHGPELLDISITNYCTKGCNICYRNSHKNGKHILLSDLEIILRQAKELDVRQIALGGGNPNQHPDFIAILDLIRQKYGIIPSYTTNGDGINDDIIKATKENCGVVAVSIPLFRKENYEVIEKFIENSIKTNIHFVVTSETIDEAIRMLENKKNIPRHLNAIVFLNYKPVGNLKSEKLKVIFSNKIEYFFGLVENKKITTNIGFDSCFVSGICQYTTIDKSFYDFCEAARFSAFIDEEMNMYPCSFFIGNQEKQSLQKLPMIKIWQESSVFTGFRQNFFMENCNCRHQNICHGGCHVFPINFCSKMDKITHFS